MTNDWVPSQPGLNPGTDTQQHAWQPLVQEDTPAAAPIKVVSDYRMKQL